MLLEGEMTTPGLTEWMSIMSDEGRWAILPAECKTSGLQARAVAMLSRDGCEVWTLQKDHENYQLKLFSLMDAEDADIPRLVCELQQCRMDRWSKGIVADYLARDGDWSHDFRADLWHSALLQEFDNAAREASHASIRRNIVVASTQTHCEVVQSLAHRISVVSPIEKENATAKDTYCLISVSTPINSYSQIIKQ